MPSIEYAALEVLERDGLDGLTMRAVAKAAHLSPAAIYKAYPGKQSLIDIVLAKARQALAYELLQAGVGDTAQARLWNSGQGYLRFCLERPELYRALFVSNIPYSRNSEAATQMHHADATPYRLLLDRVREAQAAGFLRSGDPDDIGFAIWATAHGVCLMYLTGRLGRDAASEAFDKAIGCLIHGIAAPSEDSHKTHRDSRTT